jgi:hypothetical protein
LGSVVERISFHAAGAQTLRATHAMPSVIAAIAVKIHGATAILIFMALIISRCWVRPGLHLFAFVRARVVFDSRPQAARSLIADRRLPVALSSSFASSALLLPPVSGLP